MKQSSFDKLKASFKSKYKVNDKTGCWDWNAAKQQTGYGYINTFGLWRNSKPAHVVSVLLHTDPTLDLESKISVHHKCFNVSCVNPEHLVVMSAYEQSLHQEHTALGVLDKISIEFPAASTEIAALKSKLRDLLGLASEV